MNALSLAFLACRFFIEYALRRFARHGVMRFRAWFAERHLRPSALDRAPSVVGERPDISPKHFGGAKGSTGHGTHHSPTAWCGRGADARVVLRRYPARLSPRLDRAVLAASRILRTKRGSPLRDGAIGPNAAVARASRAKATASAR